MVPMGIPTLTAPAQAVLMMLAGWLNREHQAVIHYRDSVSTQEHARNPVRLLLTILTELVPSVLSVTNPRNPKSRDS